MGETRSNDVVCIGNICLDIPLQDVDESVFHTDSNPVERIFPTIGGSAANVSIVLSRLGHKPALITLLGQDVFAEMALSFCRENAVDIDSVARDERVDTALNIGLVQKNGERTFIVSRRSSTFHFNINHVDMSRLKGAKLLTIASIFINPLLDEAGLIQIFQAAKRENLIICADMMKSRDGKKLDSIRIALPYIDYFFPNYEEAAFLTDKTNVVDISDVLLDCGIKNVIIKRGREGCFVRDSKDQAVVQPFLNPHPIDTIGAGDNFVAGFISAILAKMPLLEAARYANAVAAISVGSVGATGGVLSSQQVAEFIASQTTSHES